MSARTRKSCPACRGTEKALTKSEAAACRRRVPGWSIVQRKGIRQLERGFRFRDFAEALAFANRVGRLAEREFHHPALRVEWGRVTVAWWTHAIRGLRRRDFVMAAKTDRAYR